MKKKDEYQSFDEFLETDEAEKIVDRVMEGFKKEGKFIKGRVRRDDAP